MGREPARRISPTVLRRLYEASFAAGIHGAAVAKLDVSFEDYYAFVRLHGPLVTRRSAAEHSLSARFRELANTFPPNPIDDDGTPSDRVAVDVERLERVDLARLAFDRRCQLLTLDRIADVSGWASLARWKHLEQLAVTRSTSTEPIARRHAVRIAGLEVEYTTAACVRVIVATVDATRLSLATKDVLDLAPLALGRAIRDFRAAAPTVRGVARLDGLPIEELALGNVRVDAELRATLSSLGRTLRRLFLATQKPFAAASLGGLGGMPALRHVLVHADRKDRAAWIDLAVAHPTIGFDFI